MTGFEELKNAYGILKDEYSYICARIMPPDEECEGQRFLFQYQGFPEKITFMYTLYDVPYPENDNVEFDSSEDSIVFSAAAYFAIADFIRVIQKNRDDKNAMNEFIKYLEEEIHNNE